VNDSKGPISMERFVKVVIFFMNPNNLGKQCVVRAKVPNFFFFFFFFRKSKGGEKEKQSKARKRMPCHQTSLIIKNLQDTQRLILLTLSLEHIDRFNKLIHSSQIGNV